jgi:nitroreductase
VPLELVKESLEVALQAPTGGNSQGWHWMVVTDPDLRAGLGDYYRRSFEAYRDGARRAAAAYDDADRRATQARVGSSAQYLADHMGEVPVLVLACIEAGADLPAENQAGLWGSLLPAAWSYQLAARARGLGTAWTTLHLMMEQQVADIVGIPFDEVQQVCLSPLAYTVGTDFRPVLRPDPETIIHWDRW